MRIPDRHFTGHWSHVESRTAFEVSKIGRSIPMTQENFAALLDKMERREEVRFCRSIDAWYREMGL